MNLTGRSAESYWEYFTTLHPELIRIRRQADTIANRKKAVYPYQAAALYDLAKPYNGGQALEIGTAYGYSCTYLASAMPDSKITTLNASIGEIEAVQAAGTLKRFPNVRILHRLSWEYFEESDGTAIYNFIFVDGDHRPEPLRRDLQYFNRLVNGGLMVFHDYAPLDSKRACPPVYEGLNQFAERLGRKPDVLIVDDHKVGMAGFIRRPGEVI